MKKKKIYKVLKGLTIVETIMTIMITTIVMGGFTYLFSRLWKVYGFTIETGVATRRATHALDDAKDAIIKARISENGSYPIVSVGENEFSFYSDYDDDGVVERVRYFLDAQQLKVGIIEPDTSQKPVSYEDETETITTVARYVVNDVIIDSGETCTQYQLASKIDGSAGNRFTSIGMARNVKHASQYYFNLEGNEFSTQVTDDGWVLVAAGNRSTDEASYDQVSNLYYDSDNILNSGILANFTNIEQIRVQATNESWLENELPHDVVTNDSHMINDIIAFRTFGHTSSDDATWECYNPSDANCADQKNRMKINPPEEPPEPGCASDNLNKHLYFACENENGFSWSLTDGPIGTHSEQIKKNNRGNDINLYVRGANESNIVYLTATKTPCGGKDFTGDDGLCYSEQDLINAGAVCTDIDGTETSQRPLFTYYGDFELLGDFDHDTILANKLTSPVDKTKIELIRILLNINVDPKQKKGNTQVETFINIRNLAAKKSTSSP